MKLDKLIDYRSKECPSDCRIDSHALMVRGGYIVCNTRDVFVFDFRVTGNVLTCSGKSGFSYKRGGEK